MKNDLKYNLNNSIKIVRIILIKFILILLNKVLIILTILLLNKKIWLIMKFRAIKSFNSLMIRLISLISLIFSLLIDYKNCLLINLEILRIF